MKSANIFLLILAGITGLNAIRKSYDGYQVINIEIQTTSQLKYMRLLSDNERVDFSGEPSSVGSTVEILVAPEVVEDITTQLQKRSFSFEITNSDVESYLSEEFERYELRRDEAGRMSYNFSDYNDYDAMIAKLNDFVNNCTAPLSCTLEEIGTTYEGRPLTFLEITTSPGDETKMGFWFDSLIHAREWVAGTTNMNVINHLIFDYGVDSEVTYLLDTYNLYFLPIMNPDGYIFAWESDRFWRKSRNINDNSTCVGTDLNRNYDASWATDGVSPDPCSNVYHGTGPASEPETVVVQDKAREMAPRLWGFVSVHTAANMWLHPLGNTVNGTCERSVDHDDQFRVGEAAALATMAAYNTTWTYGSICETIYPASGTTCDYAYVGAGIKYSFTPELRGPGFDPPPSAIEPAWIEFWAGAKAMIYEIEAIAMKRE